MVLFLMAMAVLPYFAMGQNSQQFLSRWSQYSDAPNALYRYVSSEAQKHLANRTAMLNGIHSLAQWQERQAWIQKTLSAAIGPFPDRTSLNPKITNIIEKETYQLENIVFESQPGHFVTAALFVPRQLKAGKAPAIVYCSGHSATGYRSYQRILINLVNKGFVVLAFDPIGQGERVQYMDTTNKKPLFKYPAWEHSYIGAQLFMTGNTLARNMLWDGMRAIDYLVTRPEVDTTRIGITGRSGGGTQTAYIAAMDHRIKAYAPENYITNFTRLFQSIGPQDAEQNFLYGIREGLDMGDLLIARAPIPCLVLATSRDMFPIQGTIETCEEVGKIYQAYGKPNLLRMVTDDAPHASTQPNREAMYAFFQQHLQNPGNPADEEVELLSADELRVTPTGQVGSSYPAETVHSLNLRDAVHRLKLLDAERKGDPSSRVRKARELTGYATPSNTSKPVFTGRSQKSDRTIEQYILFGEDGYPIPCLLFTPKEGHTGHGVIYLDPAGKYADTARHGTIDWLVQNGVSVLAPDMIGTGEIGPGSFKGDSYLDSVSYNVWFATVQIGKTIVGIQASDIIRLARFMKVDKGVHAVYGFSRTEMAPALLHAAAFEKDIEKVVLIAPYSSYRSIVMNPIYRPTFLHSTVPGSIGEYDLPDLAASLAPRILLIIGATDGNGNNDQAHEIEKDMQLIRDAYQKKAASHLRIIERTTDQFHDQLKAWIDH